MHTAKLDTKLISVYMCLSICACTNGKWEALNFKNCAKKREEIKTCNVNYYFNHILQTISWSLIFILERFWVLTFLSCMYIFKVCKSEPVSIQYLYLYNEN